VPAAYLCSLAPVSKLLLAHSVQNTEQISGDYGVGDGRSNPATVSTSLLRRRLELELTPACSNNALRMMARTKRSLFRYFLPLAREPPFLGG
jgi:hypothetical protein